MPCDLRNILVSKHKIYAKIPLMKQYRIPLTSLILASSLLFSSCSMSEAEPAEENLQAEQLALEEAKNEKLQHEKELFEKRHTQTFQNCYKTGAIASNKACLSKIENFVSQANEENKQQIIIEVHTDKLGGSKANLNISKKRAYELAKELYTKENKTSNVYYKGFGEAHPLVDAEDKKANSINRRIVVTLKDKNYAVNTNEFKKYVKHIVLKSKKNKSTKDVFKITSVKKKIKKDFGFKGTAEPIILKNSEKKKEKIVPKVKKQGNTKFKKYTGKADTGWMYFGKAELKNKFDISCLDDKPRKVRRKSISSTKKKEFMRGLRDKRISGDFGSKYIEINPIYIYENGSLPISNPIATLYDDSRDIKRYQTTVNTYRGTRGILYRVFINGHKDMKCMDLVLSYETREVSFGTIYMQEGSEIKAYKFKPEN